MNGQRSLAADAVWSHGGGRELEQRLQVATRRLQAHTSLRRRQPDPLIQEVAVELAAHDRKPT